MLSVRVGGMNDAVQRKDLPRRTENRLIFCSSATRFAAGYNLLAGRWNQAGRQRFFKQLLYSQSTTREAMSPVRCASTGAALRPNNRKTS
jgi:hypothetical protein